ncbi:YwmB family TATA-box binding protein [Evansella clarkii]|jgi:hypothetical protein|uniref:YwmB family TATA-box binding protein n=1 Tax=Evansella clarkii TaxID=79879 RepID=UPI000B433029|nr:YwmB family TATA-box binding protein [Evansella clarkii]
MGKIMEAAGIVALLLISFMFLLEKNDARSEAELTQHPQYTLQQINEAIANLEIEPDGFYLYARNHQDDVASYDKVMEYLDNWKQDDERVNWTFQKTNGQEQWTGTLNHPDVPYSVETSVYAEPKGTEGKYEVYTVVQASFIPTPQWETAFSELFGTHSLAARFDTEDIFLRAEGTVAGDNAADLQRWGQKLMESFNANVVEELNEETFISISAYTPNWGNVLETNGRKINLQAAMRRVTDGLGGKTNITIGTPLITTEY